MSSLFNRWWHLSLIRKAKLLFGGHLLCILVSWDWPHLRNLGTDWSLVYRKHGPHWVLNSYLESLTSKIFISVLRGSLQLQAGRQTNWQFACWAFATKGWTLWKVDGVLMLKPVLFSAVRFPVFIGFPGSSAGKESAYNAEDPGSIPGLGRSPGGGHGNPLQCSCLENPHWQRSLVGYSPWGCKESDTTEPLRRTYSLFHCLIY